VHATGTIIHMPLLWYAIAAMPPPAHPGAGVLAGIALAVAAVLAVALAGRIVTRSQAWSTVSLARAVRLRAGAHRVRAVRLLDPDAAGRPRPRAPSRTR
jgi:hypothetical protein